MHPGGEARIGAGLEKCVWRRRACRQSTAARWERESQSTRIARTPADQLQHLVADVFEFEQPEKRRVPTCWAKPGVPNGRRGFRCDRSATRGNGDGRSGNELRTAERYFRRPLGSRGIFGLAPATISRNPLHRSAKLM